MEKLKILLTGATGFIGNNFVLNLHNKYDIVALVRESSDVSKIKSFCKIYRYDETIDSIKEVFENEKIDGVVHMASLVPSSSNLINDIALLIDANILFGTRLLQMVVRFDISFFINTSTFGSYCNSLEYRPAMLYAATKKAFEDIMEYYSLVSSCTFSSLLVYNVYGNGDTKYLFSLLDKYINSKDALEMSDGEQIVDYSHVDDVVFGFECLINAVIKNPDFCKNKIFSLKGENRKTLKEVIGIYEKILGKKLNIKWGARPRGKLDILIPWEGGEKIPNWKQRISFEEGFKRLIDGK